MEEWVASVGAGASREGASAAVAQCIGDAAPLVVADGSVGDGGPAVSGTEVAGTAAIGDGEGVAGAIDVHGVQDSMVATGVAIGEGAAILKDSEFKFDLREVFRVYNNESIIDSRLINWALNELKKDPNLSDISSTIGSGGG